MRTDQIPGRASFVTPSKAALDWRIFAEVDAGSAQNMHERQEARAHVDRGPLRVDAKRAHRRPSPGLFTENESGQRKSVNAFIDGGLIGHEPNRVTGH
jgi:hypothetical protein